MAKSVQSTFFCTGKWAVLSLLEHSPGHVERVLVQEGTENDRLREVRRLTERGAVPLETLARGELARVVGEPKHQGIAAEVRRLEQKGFGAFLEAREGEGPLLVVALAHLQDPHNVGAVIRSAEACGAAAVVLPERRSARIAGGVLKSSAGAAARLPLFAVPNLSRALRESKERGLWVVGLDPEGSASLWECDGMPARCVLVVGNEERGLGHAVTRNADMLYRIPLQGTTASLNASVAAALGMFEWARRRKC
ncbi:MAG: 23S rRNA (guanosine(2251)-2'-O)-methyltransferase RlmB [Synergistales bacterium]|nr:23S rRNA (guanosine(2251)-2'-O)-methyltransferase RlmB [Synergistales bacterium]